MNDHIRTFAHALKEEGVCHAFGVTGSGSSLKLIRALDALGIPCHATQTEAAAVLMAGAAGFDGQLRGASITIKGPGFANALAGLVANRYEGRPMVSVSEAFAEDAPAGLRHKRLDHVAMTQGIVRAHAAVGERAADMRTVIRQATGTPPGPVHFDLMPTPGSHVRMSPNAAVATDEHRLPALLQRLAQAARPAVVLGREAGQLLPHAALNGFSVPVATTAHAKGLCDERLPCAAGVVTGECGRLAPERTSLARADLILGLGLSNEEFVNPAAMTAPLVLIDAGPGPHRLGFDPVEAATAPSPHELAQRLEVTLAGKAWGTEDVEDRNRAITEHLSGFGNSLPEVLQMLQEWLPAESVLVPDTGFHCTVAETCWRACRPEGVLGASRSRYMGLAVPTAIGRALAFPAEPVLCVFGEGGVAAHFFELGLAVRLRLPILFLFCRDGQYASVAAFSTPDVVLERATAFAHAPAWEMARALGCPAARLTSIADLRAVLANRDSGQGPMFLQFDFDPLRYAALAKELR